ncbi:MAG: hypothetical protein ACXV3A_02380 [Kineosporiaceae bacterium]
MSEWVPGVRGLFQQRAAGDDALLRLTALRFAQAGMPAELYADTPERLHRLLGFVPEHSTPPVVHLNRGVGLLDAGGRQTIREFAQGFAGRISGLVIHDKAIMWTRMPEVVSSLREVGDRPDGPVILLEYAAGAPLMWFAELADRIRDVSRAGICIDTGHVGLAEVRRVLAAGPNDAQHVTVGDPRLAQLAGQIQAATAVALPAVCGLVRDVGRSGTTLHLHLHDGHPAIPGLSDHWSFLIRVPVPFDVDGARSLAPIYGPSGLSQILTEAVDSCPSERLSLTLEIHQAPAGRLPIGEDAASLFRHWTDVANAERQNYWLSVITDNHVLATSALRAVSPRPA